MRYTDVGHLSREAQEAIEYCSEHGLMQGVGGGLFAPDNPAPRWQQAILMARVHRLTREFPDLIAPLVDPAVVMVIDEQTGALGSGVSIGGGYIVTNAHVVLRPDGTHADMMGIRWDNYAPHYAMGPVIAIRRDKDLAIIRADIGENRLLLPRIRLAQVPIRKGEPLTCIGSPLGLIGNMTHGVVSYLNRGLRYTVDGVRTLFAQSLQTDAAINPGNSGGAAVNRRGELVGIPSAKLAGVGIEGLGFCIGVPDIEELLRQVNLMYVPDFHRPDYENSPAGFNVSVRTHYMDIRRVNRIVVHHTGDVDRNGNNIHVDVSAEAINTYHRTVHGWAGIGYHFVIRWDGLIQVGRSIYTQGAHAGGAVNPISWGVVFSGNFNVAQPTEVQLASWFWLKRYLNEVQPGLSVSLHRHHGVTDCPGRLVDIELFREEE